MYIYIYTHVYIHMSMCIYIYIHIHINVYIYIYCIMLATLCVVLYMYVCMYTYIYIYIHICGGAECLYDFLVVFGPQLFLDMWLPRFIGCSRGCGMSSCNHACESLLAWICWCGFVRRGLLRRGCLLGVDFSAWMF